jgi:hypothetical protein
MAEQIDHLRYADAEVRVLPFAAGAYLRRGPFSLLDFIDPEVPPVTYAEGPGGPLLRSAGGPGRVRVRVEDHL